MTTDVLYNGSCPICSKEIAHYARIAKAEDLPVRFDDLSASALADWGISKKQAAMRLHVRHDGTLYHGIPAFIVLWQQIPKYRWLAKIVRKPVIYPIAVFTYDRILAPLLYRWHLARERRVCAKGAE